MKMRLWIVTGLLAVVLGWGAGQVLTAKEPSSPSGTQSASEPGPGTSPASRPTTGTSPASQPRPAAFTSMQSILAKLPEGLRLKKTGWDKFEYANVKKWMTENAVGKVLETRLQVSKIQVEQAQRPKDKQEWVVSLSLVRWGGFEYAGNRHRLGIQLAPKEHIMEAEDFVVRFMVDEATARKWERRQPQFAVPVTGTIGRVELEEYGRTEWDKRSRTYGFFIRLDDLKGLEALPK